MARKRQAEEKGVDPVTLALAGMLALAAWCAYRVIAVAEAVLAAAEDRDTYAIFVTDEGLKSDNQALADKVNEGVSALKSAEVEASILLIICGVLTIALLVRVAMEARRAI